MNYEFTRKICQRMCEDAIDIMWNRGLSSPQPESKQANITPILADIRKCCDLLESDADFWDGNKVKKG